MVTGVNGKYVSDGLNERDEDDDDNEINDEIKVSKSKRSFLKITTNFPKET